MTMPGLDFGGSTMMEQANEGLTMSAILGTLGYVSSIFMTQECRGTEIVMPTEELERAAEDLYNTLKEEGLLNVK